MATHVDYDADVIVVGSGLLGALAATSLAAAGKSVIILEAGPRMQRWQVVENFRNTVDKSNPNLPYPDLPWAMKSYGGKYSDAYWRNTGPFPFRPGMLKVVGGTTWHWGAATWRYLPSDMKLQSTYGVGRDWPISYDEIEPWYQRAEEALGVSGNDADDQTGKGGGQAPRRSRPYPMPAIGWSDFTQKVADKLNGAGFHFIDEPNARNSRPYDGRPACRGNNNCMPVCPIGAMYSGDMQVAKAEAAGAKLISEAVVHKLEKGAGGKISAVRYLQPDGTEHRLTAKYVIVAAHAMETPKLLLMSDVANRSDQVGRNVMGHTGVSLLFLSKDPLWPGRGPQQQGGIMDWRDGDFRRRHTAGKHSLSNAVPNHDVAARLLAQGVIGSELNRRIREDSARWVSISTMLEQLPDPANRITLSSTRRDALGLPMPDLYNDPGDYLRAGVAPMRGDYQRFLELFEGTLIKDDGELENHDHLMGSVIMGADPRDSVVDGDCRSHDHPNLFLVTTGVIPAAGVVNPTLTGAALALRVAELLGREA
ncbi:GMC family oxidoreductase [Frateuria aurantia]